MSLRPQPIGLIPEETIRVATAAFPGGNLYMRMRDEFGPIFTDACDPQKPWSRYLRRANVPVLRLPWGNISGLVHSEV
jgi:hypothetical protein